MQHRSGICTPWYALFVPGGIGAEVPDVTFEIAAGLGSAAVVLVLDVDGNFGPSGFGASVVSVGVGHDDVRCLGFGSANLFRLLNVASVLVGAHRTQHDHAVAVCQL